MIKHSSVGSAARVPITANNMLPRFFEVLAAIVAGLEAIGGRGGCFSWREHQVSPHGHEPISESSGWCGVLDRFGVARRV
jgi:hypothetical protein